MDRSRIHQKRAKNAPQRVPSLTALLRLCRAVLGLGLFSLLGCLWLILPIRLGVDLPRYAFSILCWSFGIRIEHLNSLPQTPGLLLANHVSWTDIAVIGAISHIGFVAKNEVRHWPFIGKLAERYGCVFVARGRRAAVKMDMNNLARFASQRSVILFPEGTTGDGSALLPFRSSLVGAVAGTTQHCSPLALAYYWADGRPLGHAGWTAVAWVGEEGLMPHVLRLALMPPIKVIVSFGEPIYATCRKDLCHRASQSVKMLLAQSYGH